MSVSADQPIRPRVPVSGHCDEQFDAVARPSPPTARIGGDRDPGVTVFVGDRLVVDLVGRWVDPGLNAPWHSDTPVAVYSVGKSVVALLLLQSVDEGNPELEDPVASVWPEFGCAGKESATVRQALCHRAGVSVIRQLMTNEGL